MSRKILLLLAWILAGCGTPKQLPTEDIRDSVSVIIKESVIYNDSIIYVEVPVEVYKDVAPITDTSYLETSLAESCAYVLDNKLHHTLSNKSDVRIPKIITMPVYLTTKETEHLSSNVTTKEVEVEKELTDWQTFRMMLGTIVLVIAGIVLLIYILKRTLLK